MHRELEVKFSIGEPSLIRNKLLELGAVHIDTVDQVDIYYQHPCRNFAETDEALRLRENSSKNSGNIELTYKGPKSSGWVKDRVEVVSRVLDSREIQEILEMLGFRVVAKLLKHREFYMIRGVEVSIDSVDGLGNFVEIEDKGGGLETIREIASLLDLKDPIPKTYLELYLEKFRK